MEEHDPVATKQRLLGALRDLARASPQALPEAAGRVFAPDADYLCGHPINQLHGVEQIVRDHLAPLKTAFPDLERRDDIFMGGRYAGHDWISATGYYYGVFRAPWLGLKPNDNWVYLRFGEFYKLKAGQVIDSYCMIDIVDVLRQLGVNPLPPARGVEGLCPPPAAQDGLLTGPQPPEVGRRSLELVEAMIFEGMQGFDGVDHGTMNMDRFWTPDMMWYGPAGIGTTRGLDGFMDRHEIPFNEAWPDFKGGNHKARFGDGLFVASTGWPSIHGTYNGQGFMGLPRTEPRAFTMRVMDWWRREGDWLSENWIFIDFPDLFAQFGVDLLEQARSRQA